METIDLKEAYNWIRKKMDRGQTNDHTTNTGTTSAPGKLSKRETSSPCLIP